jgi:hypothetical protein
MLLILLALMGAQQSALDAAEKAAGKPVVTTPAQQTPSQQTRALVENCDAHKFETVIQVATADGGTKHSRMRLCGMDGQSDADWVVTLKDAVLKTSTNLTMPAAVREQIVGAINSEIARLQGKAASAAVATLPPPRTIAKPAAQDEYSALPPLPDKPPAPVQLLAGGAATVPLLPKPRLSFICSSPNEIGEGPCTDFTRDTLLTVRADEDLPAGTSLRFVRSGEAKADVELAQLKRGRSMRIPLPGDVCSRAAGGRLEIRIVRAVPKAGPAGQEVGEDGPYNLRC